MSSASTGAPVEPTATAKRLPFVLDSSILITLLAASSAPTPLYPLYQDRWELSALAVTVVFSAYTLALLAALLTTGGLVFFTLSLSAAITVWATRRLRPVNAALLGSAAIPVAVALSLVGMHLRSLPAVFTAAVLAGVAFGAVSQGSLRLVLAPVPRPDRSATLAAYYVLSYAAMSLPAVGAGLLTELYGLWTAAHLYAALVALLSTAASAMLIGSLPRASAHTTAPLPERAPAACANVAATIRLPAACG